MTHQAYQPPTREDHRDMMLHPERWPLHPILPVFRRRPNSGLLLGKECGLIHKDAPFTVWLIILGGFHNDGRPVKSTDEIQSVSYTDVDSLLDDGWEVD